MATYAEMIAATKDHDEFLKARSAANQTLIGPDEVSETKQSDAHDADVNNIMKRYQPGQEHLWASARPGQWLDTTSALDYQEAHALLTETQDRFAQLPANIRAAFDNDPGKLVDAIYDPTQVERLTVS